MPSGCALADPYFLLLDQQSPREMLVEPQMGAPYVILKLLVVPLESKKDTSEIDFNTIFYLTQYIQNVSISICNHEYKIFTSPFILSLQSPAHALHLRHISTSVRWPQSGCCVSEHSSRPCSGLLILEFPASRILCPLPGPAKASAEPHAPGDEGNQRAAV